MLEACCIFPFTTFNVWFFCAYETSTVEITSDGANWSWLCWLILGYYITIFSYLHLKDFDQDEKEDFKIKPDDNLIVAGHVDQDFSTLEISGDYGSIFTPNTMQFRYHIV